MKKTEEIDPALRPPKVFWVPFVVLSLPMFLIGTLWAFLVIGFRAGVAGTLRTFFAAERKRKEAEYALEKEQAGRDLAEELTKALRETVGKDVEVIHLDRKPKDDSK